MHRSIAAITLTLLTACGTIKPVPDELRFPDTFVGQTSQPLEMYWEGGEDLLLVDDVALTDPSAPFRITAPVPFPPPRQRFLFLKRTVSVSIVFTPVAAGGFVDYAIPKSTARPLKADKCFVAGHGVLHVEASGGYVQPGPDPSIDFGHALIGQTAFRTLTLTNPNDNPRHLVIEFLLKNTFFSAAYSATETKALTELDLAAGESATIVLEFTPRKAGDVTDALLVRDSRMDRGQPHLFIHLTGSGVSGG